MHHWARNRRQKVIRDISFESGSPYNIYDPYFSSQEEDNMSSISYGDLKKIKDAEFPIKSLTNSEMDQLIG